MLQNWLPKGCFKGLGKEGRIDNLPFGEKIVRIGLVNPEIIDLKDVIKKK